jgi:branched-chain amino acid transport system substrate-binding protein
VTNVPLPRFRIARPGRALRCADRVAGTAFALALVLFGSSAAAQAPSVIKLGGTCDRTGPTQIIGIELCNGVNAYIALVNRRGGVLGNRLSYTEIDHAYIVPRVVEGYERLKQEGVVAVVNYGVPTLLGLSSRLMEDRIPALNTGTGRADAIDGEKWPYIFPGTASYWSQAGVALRYVRDRGAGKGTRIAYLYLDSPAGREGLEMVEAVAAREGYVVRSFAVQPPGLEMEPEVSAIVRDFRADWVIGSLFGKPPAVAIRQFRKAGFPLDRFLSLTYGAGEADVEEAGWDVAQGYLGVQFATLGRDPPVIQDIVRMLRDEGKEVPRYVGGAYYNRGVLTGALMVEAVRLGIQQHGLPLTGDKVRRGFESIRNFHAQGLAPPLTFTPRDHEGGGALRIYQVKDSAWVPVTNWMQGYRDEVMALVRKANGR